MQHLIRAKYVSLPSNDMKTHLSGVVLLSGFLLAGSLGCHQTQTVTPKAKPVVIEKLDIKQRPPAATEDRELEIGSTGSNPTK